MGFILLILGHVLAWPELRGYSRVWLPESLYYSTEVLRMPMDDWTLSNIWSVVVLKILSRAWTQLMLSVFITILFEVVSNCAFVLDYRWFCLWVECPWNVLCPWNGWVCDFPIDSLVVCVATGGDHSFGECFHKHVGSLGSTIFPVNGSSGWSSKDFAWLVNVILTWAESTSIISESCYLGHQDALNRAVWLLDHVIVVIKIVGTTILVFLVKIEFENWSQEPWWNRGNW